MSRRDDVDLSLKSGYEAVEEMLDRTDTASATWHLVPGDAKRCARVVVAETVVAALQAGMRAPGVPRPEPL